eukprot:12847718-Heterocapsa_arctica.AAC.1
MSSSVASRPSWAVASTSMWGKSSKSQREEPVQDSGKIIKPVGAVPSSEGQCRCLVILGLAGEGVEDRDDREGRVLRVPGELLEGLLQI